MSQRKNAMATAKAPTRRHAIAGIVAAMGGLAAGSAAWGAGREEAAAAQNTTPENLLTSLHQEIGVQANAARIYDALLDSKLFGMFTGMPAQIEREAGGAFSTFGGMISGRNVELVPNERIVQAWRPGSWAQGVYSIVRFELKAQGSKTVIVLDHTGFPPGNFSHLDPGWHQRYWDPLIKFLA